MNLKNETIDKITAYLATRPWREVEALMHEISDQVAAQLKPKAEEPKKENG
jgi:hypothetical protein